MTWHGKPPLLMLDTATADVLYVGPQHNQPVPLMDIYPDRTFRFCFTNRQMAEAVANWVGPDPFLRPVGSPAPGTPGLATVGTDLWAGLGLFAAETLPRPTVARPGVGGRSLFARPVRPVPHRAEGPRRRGRLGRLPPGLQCRRLRFAQSTRIGGAGADRRPDGRGRTSSAVARVAGGGEAGPPRAARPQHGDSQGGGAISLL